MVFDRYGYKVIKQYGKKSFLLQTNSSSEAMSVANMLNESGVVKYAQPNVYRKAKTR